MALFFSWSSRLSDIYGCTEGQRDGNLLSKWIRANSQFLPILYICPFTQTFAAVFEFQIPVKFAMDLLFAFTIGAQVTLLISPFSLVVPERKHYEYFKQSQVWEHSQALATFF